MKTRKAAYRPVVVNVTLKDHVRFTTVHRAEFKPGAAYRAEANEGCTCYELTHPLSGERACFAASELNVPA